MWCGPAHRSCCGKRLGRCRQPGSANLSSGSRTVVDDEVSQLLQTMRQRDLDAEERRRLLERLLLLERLEDASWCCGSG
ncbi:MAG: hypothetical protein CM15mP77_3850 [Synechococcus sp.]|nr:MAG: hypothetical protein CM15mP77_3850 [Synechococcus sp.]